MNNGVKGSRSGGPDFVTKRLRRPGSGCAISTVLRGTRGSSVDHFVAPELGDLRVFKRPPRLGQRRRLGVADAVVALLW